MEQTLILEKKRQRHLDRIKLSAPNFSRIDSWIQTLMTSKHGISVAHGDLVNWLIQRAAELSEAEKEELKALFFDEVRFLKQLLCDAKKAKASGEKVELGGLIQPTCAKRNYRRKKSKLASTETTSTLALQ